MFYIFVMERTGRFGGSDLSGLNRNAAALKAQRDSGEKYGE
jgi:hypothetical protein